ncbi:Imm52 family immunity protein [[Mycobacterium] zoologicum]|uniref:Imm52 family immunity protein n=1 Tax=[Mycobacterium] zoologicum TaxID=2872311 RepID=UPI002E77059E|nr:Imm52 family immunity protein [Mycolicibacter sp. MYC101]
MIAQWGPRSDSVDDAADRLSHLLSALASTDPALTGWRNRASSRRQALAQPVVTTERDDLVRRLLAGRNRTDIGNHSISAARPQMLIAPGTASNVTAAVNQLLRRLPADQDWHSSRRLL